VKNPSMIITTILLAFGFLALPERAQAVVPPPDGGYPGGNTAEGEDALFSLTTGNSNTGLGFHALFNNTIGNNNTATGHDALENNITGSLNTATGRSALALNTTGHDNTATGVAALFANTAGFDNTATGSDALENNTTGSRNTATGRFALFFNTTGSENAATGFDALFSNTTGSDNTATGSEALASNATGSQNTATGFGALFSNTTGSLNTATGSSALASNTAGSLNTASGFQALGNNTSGSFNIALGLNAGVNLTTGDNNIDIGNAGVAGEANTIRIGTGGIQTATYIAGIRGTPIGGGVAVRVNANGQLGTVGSSARFKQNIKPMDKASEAIHALKPVTFHYKKELDPEVSPQFGLVAEDVEKVNPDLVARDAKGELYAVRYEAVNAMLLNEFLKEHRTVQELKAIVAEQQKQIEGLTAGLQKVSAQLELSKPAPRTALNNQ
jgi:trimeric autotransporter adhesin